MTEDDPKTLVSTGWLADHLSDPDLRVIDASWYLPGSDRDPEAEYRDAHIPGAKFMSRMRALGIGDGHQVVVYDGMGIYSAPRVWWMFRLMGKTDVAVLDGGFPKWQAEGREVEDLPPVIRDRHMTVSRQNQMVKDVTQVASASKLGDWQIVDARSAARFRGEAAEPRAGLRSGHIPNSRNVPFDTLLNPDGTMKDNRALRTTFDEAGIDIYKPVITTCGSGVTAAVLSLALARIGHKDTALYDGSWAEWGMPSDLPVATGDT